MNTQTTSLRKMCCILFLISGLSSLHAQQYASQGGHVLDANMRVGSMGINSKRSYDLVMPRVNLLMTGNVGGGKSFQGVVPYSSVTEFSGTSALNTLSNFRRDSTSYQDLSVNLQRPFRPYYEASRQVTYTDNTRNVQSFLSNSNTSRALSQPRQNFRDYRAVRPLNSQFTPLGSSSRRLSGFSGGALDFNPPEMQSYSQTNPGLMTSQPDMLTSPSVGLQRENFLTSPAEGNTDQDMNKNNLKGQPELENKKTSLELPQAYYTQFNQRLREIENLQRQSQQAIANESFENLLEKRKEDERSSRSTKDISIPSVEVVSRDELYQKQFNYYMTLGEQLLQQGRFYDAVDTFDNASLYSTSQAVILMAKSHALFCAGEFMSSAFFLNNAIEQSPKMVTERVDLRKILNDNDKFNKRIEDIKKWHAKSNDPKLLFLLGYIQMQIGEDEEARKSLHSCQSELSDLAAVNILLSELGDN